MLNANELRIGNLFIIPGINREVIVVAIFKTHFRCEDAGGTQFEESIRCNYQPIPLTPKWLERLGFAQLPHKTVNDGWNISLGRNRILSVACVGTPNEMVFITEEKPPEVKNIIVARNFDYDGKTYVHQIQNLYQSLTGEELTLNIPENKDV